MKHQSADNVLSVAASHAVTACRSVIQAGGTQTAAEHVALSILLDACEANADEYEMRLERSKSQAFVLAAVARRSMNQVNPSQSSSSSNNFFGQQVLRGIEIPPSIMRQTAKAGSSTATSVTSDAVETNFEDSAYYETIEVTDDDFSENISKGRTKSTPNRVPTLSITRGQKSWIARGHKEAFPIGGKIYFPSLSARYQELDEAIDMTGTHTKNPIRKRIISVCIPCYNEEAEALKRSIYALRKQDLPKNVKLEILVAVDGVVQITESMAIYLSELFGISFERHHKSNPIERVRNCNVVIVESTSSTDEFGGRLSLVLKRKNKRKINSQAWWLRSHAKDMQCEFALATDCGIVFEPNCLALLIKRMDNDLKVAGLTGYQRVMPAEMQGDGRFELFHDPLGSLLRMLQSYDFEVSWHGVFECIATLV